MKMERASYDNGKFPNDVRTIQVSDYKDVIAIGHSVLVEGKKYIVIDKNTYKCTIMDLEGNIKKIYYKYIDFIYFTLETAKDKEVIEFLKRLDLRSYSVLDYEKNSHQFKCKDGSLHSYSYLLTKYLRMNHLAKV